VYCIQTFHLRKYKLLPATVNVSKTVLEAILRAFSDLLYILTDVSNITIAPSLQCSSQYKERIESTGDRSGEYGGFSSVVSLLFVKESLTKADRCAGAFSWKINKHMFLHFAGCCFLTASLRLYSQFYLQKWTDNGQCLAVENSCKLNRRFHTMFWSYFIEQAFDLYCTMFKEIKGEREKQLSLQCFYKEKKNKKKY